MMEDTTSFRKKLIFNEGSNFFRQRLVLSILSARPVKIQEIRSTIELNVGVTGYEVSFIHLLNRITNGTRFKISETGTEVTLIPGTLSGGVVTYDCDKSRPLSYYLEPLLILAPFCKKPLQLTLKGRIQNDSAGYNSIYKIKHAAFPLMEHFGLEPELQVKSRSYDVSEIFFTCTVKKQLLTLRNQLSSDCGKVKKIRGLAYGFRVSNEMLNRVLTAAKGDFLPFISDVFITNDVVKSKSKVPGFGLVLYAETTNGIVYAADGFHGKNDPASDSDLITVISDQNLGEKKQKFNLFPDEEPERDHNAGSSQFKRKVPNSGNPNVTSVVQKIDKITSPEELGKYVAKLLLREIAQQSCVDSVFQWLVLAFMALSPKDVTSVLLGSLTPFTIQFLRDFKTFFGVTFKIESYRDTLDDEEYEEDKEKNSERQKLSCLGIGYTNMNKRTL